MSNAGNPLGGGGSSALDNAMEALKRELSKGTISRTPSPAQTSAIQQQQQPLNNGQQQQQYHQQQTATSSVYQQQQQQRVQYSIHPTSSTSSTTSSTANMAGRMHTAAATGQHQLPPIQGGINQMIHPNTTTGLPPAAVAAQAVRRASLNQQQNPRPATPPGRSTVSGTVAAPGGGGARPVGGNRIAVSIDMLQQVVKGYVASSAHQATREVKQDMLTRLNRLNWTTQNKNIQQEVVAIIGMPALQAALRSVNLLQGPSVPPRQLAAAAAAAAAANMRQMRAAAASPYGHTPPSPQEPGGGGAMRTSMSSGDNSRGGIAASTMLRRPMPMDAVEREKHLSRAICNGGDVKVLAGIDLGYEQALLRIMYAEKESPSGAGGGMVDNGCKIVTKKKRRPALLPADPIDKRQRLAIPLSYLEGQNEEYTNKIPITVETVDERLSGTTAYRGGISDEACNAVRAITFTLLSSLAELILEDKRNLEAAKHRTSHTNIDGVSEDIGGRGGGPTNTPSMNQYNNISNVNASPTAAACSSSNFTNSGQQTMVDNTTPIMSIFNFPQKSDDFNTDADDSSFLEGTSGTSNDMNMMGFDRTTPAHVYYTLNLMPRRFYAPCSIQQLPLKIPRQLWPVWLSRAHDKVVAMYIKQSSITIATQLPIPLSSSSSSSIAADGSGIG